MPNAVIVVRPPIIVIAFLATNLRKASLMLAPLSCCSKRA
jgi:hypothetical protein